jgi:hypothetical protein
MLRSGCGLDVAGCGLDVDCRTCGHADVAAMQPATRTVSV